MSVCVCLCVCVCVCAQAVVSGGTFSTNTRQLIIQPANAHRVPVAMIPDSNMEY